jgi:hypothetical protein
MWIYAVLDTTKDKLKKFLQSGYGMNFDYKPNLAYKDYKVYL